MSSYSISIPNSRDIIAVIFSVVILLTGASVPFSANFEYDIQLVLTIFSFTIVLWVTKPIPYSISSLFCVILLYAFGLVDSFDEAATGFSSSLIFFMILLLLIGESINKVDLDKWVANRLVSATSTPKRSIRRIFSTTLLLTFLMPSGMARTVTLMPVIDQINESYGLSDASQFRRLSYYLIGHLNLVGSLALMTGGGLAITTAEMINSLVHPITWVEWALYMSPPAVVLFTISGGVATILYDVNGDATAITDQIHTSNQVTGGREALSNEQKLVVGTLVVAIFAWIIGSFVSIPTIMPAIFVVVVFSLPGVRIITADEVRTISWEIIFLLGAMLSLLEVIRNVNAFDPLTAVLGTSLPLQAHPAVVLTILFLSAILVRGAFSSVAGSFIILFPILLEFTTLIDANPLYVAFGLSIILMSVNFFPFNNPVVLIAYEKGPLRVTEVLLLGLLTLAISFFVLIFCWNIYWPLVDTITGTP